MRTDDRRNGRSIDILVTEAFAPRPKLSQFIYTPEKAARLGAKMEAEGFFND